MIAALAVNSLLGARAAANLFRRSGRVVDDGDYLAEWTNLLSKRIGESL